MSLAKHTMATTKAIRVSRAVWNVLIHTACQESIAATTVTAHYRISRASIIFYSSRYGQRRNLSSTSTRWNAIPAPEPAIENVKTKSAETEKSDEPQVPRTYNVTKADARPVLSTHHKPSWDERTVKVPWEEGKTSIFHNIWLRDHCRCHGCLNVDTKQRMLDTFSIPANIQASEVQALESGLRIIWKQDNHESYFSYDWLHLHSYNPRLQKYLSSQFKLWGSEITERPPTVSFVEVMESDEGVARWTSKIFRYGLCYVEGVPANPEDTKKLVERIAYIRNTHYGGFWDTTVDQSNKDLAYTNMPLNLHTDNTYFTDPSGLMLFHLLSHEGDGGQSVLVDGFKAARILRDEKPEYYRMLSQVRIPAHASGSEEMSIQPYAPFPVLNHHPVDGELVQVRWNNYHRGTLDRWDDPSDVDTFYDAIRHWNDILQRRDMDYRDKLVPGKALIFNNWRVLHGRTGFTGIRRICGAYVNYDDFISRFLTTNTNRGDVLKAI